MKFIRTPRPPNPESLGQFLDNEFRKLASCFSDLADVVVAEVVLLNGTTSTTISHGRIRSDAVISLTPTDAASATFLTSVYQVDAAPGSLTLDHTDPGSDLTFAYVIHIPLNTITR